jgi:hypothetical protein
MRSCLHSRLTPHSQLFAFPISSPILLALFVSRACIVHWRGVDFGEDHRRSAIGGMALIYLSRLAAESAARVCSDAA